MKDKFGRDMSLATLPLATAVTLCICYSCSRISTLETERQASVSNLSATRVQTNGVEYLSIPVNGEEVKLFYYNRSYLPADKIRQAETEQVQRQAESNLTTRLEGVIGR